MVKIKCPACGEIILGETFSCAYCGYPVGNLCQPEDCTTSEPEYVEEDISEDDFEEVAQQINKFNWGACLLTPFWGFANGMPWLFLIYLASGLVYLALFMCSYMLPLFLIASLIPFACSIYFGITGSRLAWNKKEWQSITHFISVQQAWTNWGFAILVVCFFLSTLGFLFIHRLFWLF
jgi:hypothetical protein